MLVRAMNQNEPVVDANSSKNEIRNETFRKLIEEFRPETVDWDG